MTPSHATTLSGTDHIHISQRQERYKLRPQRIKHTTLAPGSSSKSSGGRVRLEPWETKLLLDTFKAGIWNPGNAIVESLISDLQGVRSKKQVKSWFSHQRRLVREKGASSTQGEEDPDKSAALEGLIMLKHQQRRETNSHVVREVGRRKIGGLRGIIRGGDNYKRICDAHTD